MALDARTRRAPKKDCVTQCELLGDVNQKVLFRPLFLLAPLDAEGLRKRGPRVIGRLSPRPMA